MWLIIRLFTVANFFPLARSSLALVLAPTFSLSSLALVSLHGQQII